jgi:hypothetical protein
MINQTPTDWSRNSFRDAACYSRHTADDDWWLRWWTTRHSSLFKPFVVVVTAILFQELRTRTAYLNCLWQEHAVGPISLPHRTLMYSYVLSFCKLHSTIFFLTGGEISCLECAWVRKAARMFCLYQRLKRVIVSRKSDKLRNVRIARLIWHGRMSLKPRHSTGVKYSDSNQTSVAYLPTTYVGNFFFPPAAVST